MTRRWIYAGPCVEAAAACRAGSELLDRLMRELPFVTFPCSVGSGGTDKPTLVGDGGPAVEGQQDLSDLELGLAMAMVKTAKELNAPGAKEQTKFVTQLVAKVHVKKPALVQAGAG
jgi:hypothetical protein